MCPEKKGDSVWATMSPNCHRRKRNTEKYTYKTMYKENQYYKSTSGTKRTKTTSEIGWAIGIEDFQKKLMLVVSLLG